MLKSEPRPLTAGCYSIITPPKAAQQDNILPLRPRKCARYGCNKPHTRNSLWCRDDQNCGPETSCDCIPAITE